MEKLSARFVTTSRPGKYIKAIRLDDITIYQVEYDEKDTQRILEQTDQYFLSKHNSYYYENDVYRTVKKGEGYGEFEIKKLISSFSQTYSTDEPQADILVFDKEFIGVVVQMRERGGSTWSSYHNEWFVIHYTDGCIVGKNKSEDVVNTEDNSSEDIKSYYLIKK